MFPSGVDICFPVGRRTSYREILESSSESAHRVPFEVAQNDHEIIVQHILAYNVVLEDQGSCRNRYGDFPVTVHQVNSSDLVEPVIFDGLVMFGRVLAASAICGVALHYLSFHFLQQLSYKFRMEVVVISGFPGGDLHGNLSGGFASKCLVGLNEGG